MLAAIELCITSLIFFFIIATLERQSAHLLHQSLNSLLDTQTILNKKEDQSFVHMANVLLHRLQAVLKQLLSISVKRK